MSLQIWLPLNGDLHNQGLYDLIVANHNATIEDGKLGKSYYFNGNKQWLEFSKKLDGFYNNDWSLCVWLKPTDSTRSIIISDYNGSGASNVGIELTTGRVVRVYWNGTPDIYFNSAGGLTINTWTHIALTKSGSVFKLYYNGVLKQTYTYSGTLSERINNCPLRIGDDYRGNSASTVSYKGYMNDFRMYDHCLSPKEIKEISKALILHYPFKDIGITPYNQNLLPDTNVNALTKFLGANARYYEQTSTGGYTITWITISDPPVPGIMNGIELTKTANVAIHSITWYQNSLISVSDVPYTMSIYVKYISGTDLTIRFAYGKDPYVNSDEISVIDDGEWHQYSWTFIPETGSGKAAANGTTRIYCGGLRSTAGTIQICGWKLEKGTIATPWNEYGNTIYDCSGYGHNGMAMGSLTPLATSPRFGKSIKFDNTAKHILISNFPTTGFGDSYTFAWWGIKSAQDTMYWGFTGGIRLNGMYNGNLWNTGDGSDNPLYIPGTTTQVAAPALNTWAHWVMTGDGTTCKVYQNGVLWGEAKTYKSIDHDTIIINGWDTLTNYSSSNISIADFRIYATALSADEVKELYDTSVTIDNKGNTYAREEIEQDNTLLINKKGQFINNKLVENTSNSTTSIMKSNQQLNVNTFYEY